MADRMILIDTLAILYRGHYAMIKKPLRGGDGTVTSGLSHLLSEIFRLLEEYPESLMVAVGDAPGPTFRNEIFPDYKANRPETPPDLIEQTRLAREIIPLMGISYIEKAGLEADDIIAGLAGESSIPVLIVSPDKDLLQLVSERISVLRPGRYGGAPTLVTEGEVKRIMGVTADRVADLLALMGDASDNIPGARGIGPKGAKKLLEDHGSVEGIYSNLSAVTPDSMRKRLVESEEAVALSRKLTELNRPLPPEISSLDLEMKPPDTAALLPLLRRLSLTRIAGITGVSLSEKGKSGEPVPYSCMVQMVEDGDEPLFPGEGPLCIDTETTSKDPSKAELIGVSVTSVTDRSWFFNFRGTQNPRKMLDFIGKSAITRGYIAQNAKYDARMFARYGVSLPAPSGDPYLADYLLRPDAMEHSLKKIVPIWLNRTMKTFDEVSRGSGSLADTPVEEIARYCCIDSSSTLALSNRLDDEFKKDPLLEKVYRNVELPLSTVLMKMEMKGIGLDREALRIEGEQISREIFRLMDLAAEQSGRSINLASPSQVATVIFDQLGLKPVRKTSGGARSTGITVLEALRGQHPMIETLIEFRELSKLLNTYVQKLPGYVDESTGLIHTSFNQAVTATGRLSSSNPNMQNIPIRTKRGREIRRCFIPPVKDHVFVTADYSQIELRLLAHFTGDGALRRAYSENADIHSRTAEAIFGDASPDHRRKAKEVNFSIIYGISPYGLSQRLSIPRAEAAGIISRYYETYPEVREFYENSVADAVKNGEVRTILGRKRSFGEISDARGNSRMQMERAAVNTKVQGSAADVIKVAMIKVSERLNRELPAAALVLQVHDELVVTCPEEVKEKASGILRNEMQTAMELEVPLTVETGWGENWLVAGH